MQDKLDQVAAGQIDRLLIKMPVRHGKSESTTARFPAYVLDLNPSNRIMLGTHSQELASKFSRKNRRIARELGIPLNPERRAAHDWETATEGGLRAAGRTGGVTGFGANGLLLDDMIKSRAEAQSKAYREAIWDAIQDDFMSRLEAGAWLVVVGTPWHHDDHLARFEKEYGRVEEGGEFVIIELPALAEEGDPLGRRPGEALCPDRYTRDQLLRIKSKILPSSWNGLYQVRATPREGEILKYEWIARHTSLDPDFLLRVQSWDSGTKPNQRNDPTVCTTWRVYRSKPYFRLESQWRDTVTYPNLKRAIVAEAASYDRVDAVLIEDKGNGTAALQELGSETTLNLVAVEPIIDKLTRFEIQSNQYRLGNVSHPDKSIAPWIVDFDEEVTTIPAAPHDDRGDSTAQALAWMSGHTHGFTFAVSGRGLESRQADEYLDQ